MEENNDLDFLKAFINFHRFVFRNAVPLIIFCVIGAGIGLIRYTVISDVYKGDFVLLDGGCPKYLIQESMQSVEYGIAENTQEEIPKILSSVLEVSVDTNLQESIKVTVQTSSDSLSYLQLETAVASLLTYNRTLSGYMQDIRGEMDAEMKRMQADLAEMKTVQQKLVESSDQVNGAVALQAMSKNIVSLHSEIGILERQLNRVGSYKVVRPLGKLERLKRGAVAEIIFGMIAGFFLGLLITAYVSVLRKVKVQG